MRQGTAARRHAVDLYCLLRLMLVRPSLVCRFDSTRPYPTHPNGNHSPGAPIWLNCRPSSLVGLPLSTLRSVASDAVAAALVPEAVSAI